MYNILTALLFLFYLMVWLRDHTEFLSDPVEINDITQTIDIRGESDLSNLWVSDLIKGEETQWKNGDIVCINSGTGIGKSQFVRNELSIPTRGTRISYKANVRWMRMPHKPMSLLPKVNGSK